MRSSTYKNYLLTLLLVVLAFTFLDRFALGLIQEDIKADLGLSDTQVGVLTGIAFAVFYSVMGIPIARWADRGNRVTILSLTTALLGAAVALCGFAASFVQLLLIRIACAVGEAGSMPPSHSLIAELFNRAERPRAASRFMMGVPLSGILAYFAAGWLNEYYGWRVTFIALGLPSLFLAALVRLTVREPRSSHPSVQERGPYDTKPDVPSLSTVFATLWRNVTFRHLLMSFVVIWLFAMGIGQWRPAFFLRSFDMGTGELGTWFAIVFGPIGLVGCWLGGEMASRFAPRNERLQLTAMAAGYVVVMAADAWAFIAPEKYTALVLLAIVNFAATLMNGPLFATIQTLVPERMRAMSIAVVFLCGNLIGMGLGPLAAGALSDLLRPVFGDESLRYALLALCPGYLWGGWHLWRASRTVAADLGKVQVSRPSTGRQAEALAGSSE